MWKLSRYFIKNKEDIYEFRQAYFNSKRQIVLDLNYIRPSLDLAQQQIMRDIGVWVSEGSGWQIDSIDGHYDNVVAYKPSEKNSYIPLPVELQHHQKGFININNEDNECFRWCHVKHMNPQDIHPERIKK